MSNGWHWRGNVAHYDFLIDGVRYRGSLGVKKDSGIVDGKRPEARATAEVRSLMTQIEQKHTIEQVWEQTRRRLTGEAETPFNHSDIWNEFITHGMTKAGESRRRIYSANLKNFCTWVKQHYPRITKVSQITDSIAKEYFTWLLSMDGSPSTKNDKLVTLKMIFSHLSLPANPFEKIKPLPLRQVTRDIFTPAQIHTLFTKSTGWMRQLFITALATFQREEDCCLIKKSYITLETNRIKFPFTHKTGQDIDLPMLPLFREIVEEALADENNDTEYLFPQLAQIYLNNPWSIGKKVKKFFQEIGIDNTQTNVPGYIKKVSTLDVHSLRHTAAVMAVLSGWPLPMVMKATGHRSLSMVMRYIDHISEQQKENYFFQFGKGIPELPGHSDDSERKTLADLAYSLPIEEVKRLLSLIQAPRKITLELPGNL